MDYPIFSGQEDEEEPPKETKKEWAKRQGDIWERDILGAKRRRCFKNRGCNILCQLLFRVEENEVLELTLGFGNVEDIGDLDKCTLVEVVGVKVLLG